MTVTRPVLRYHGGKWKIAPWVIEHFPPHRVYVEPFGGSASVLMQKAPAVAEVYNDLDDSVARLFRVLRDPESAAELARGLELTPFARTEFALCYEPTACDIEAARRLIARSLMGQSSKGAFQRSGFDTRINPDGYQSRVNALRHVPAAVREAAERLRGVLIEHDDAIAVIRRHDRPDALFYCDPPYVRGTRGSHVYRHDMTDDDHRALAEVLHQVRGMVVLSGYPCELYDVELYPDWHRVSRRALADGAAAREEVLWLNPAAAAGLRQQPLFAGGVA